MVDQQPPPMTRPRVAAGALFFDSQGRVLHVKPTHKDGWDIPGGYVEPAETPLEACKREVREELGFDPTIRQLLVTDWAPSESEGHKLLFVFDGGTLTPEQVDALKLADDELEAWAFKDQTEILEVLPPRLQRRITHAFSAAQTGHHIYLEHGSEPAGMQLEDHAWWTTDHVADYLGITASTVRAYLAREQMPEPDMQVGPQRLWRPETIQRWHQQRPRKIIAETASIPLLAARRVRYGFRMFADLVNMFGSWTQIQAIRRLRSDQLYRLPPIPSRSPDRSYPKIPAEASQSPFGTR